MADVKKEIIYNGNKYILESEDNYIIEHDDPVNHPNHYKQGNRETIEVIKDYMTADEFSGYLKGNIIKYIWRYERKNGTEDLLKAQWYVNKLVETIQSNG